MKKSIQIDRKTRGGFTLVELLVAITILTLLAGLALIGLADVRETARVERTRTEIGRAHEMVMQRYETYRSRPVQLTDATTASNNGRTIALARLRALRELMRLELPDRVSDVVDPPRTITYNGNSLTVYSPLQASYQRRAASLLGASWATNWTTEAQGSECLYLILGSIELGERNGLDFFKASEIGDTDGDGMLEVLDPWGQPIHFVRWAPGLDSPLQPTSVVDPFDPLKTDPRYGDADATNDPFPLIPYIVSGGRDKAIDLVLDDSTTPLRYSTTAERNDPYVPLTGGVYIGDPLPAADGGQDRWIDNVHNHAPTE